MPFCSRRPAGDSFDINKRLQLLINWMMILFHPVIRPEKFQCLEKLYPQMDTEFQTLEINRKRAMGAEVRREEALRNLAFSASLR